MSSSHLWNGIVFGGAILGFIIGAGFASGQEILTFYTHLGFWGSFAAGLFAMLVMSVVYALTLVYTLVVIAGLDARDGKVATHGWSKLTRHDALDLARKFQGWGVAGIIYTDIGRDGMLSGINVAHTVALARAVDVPVIASGGLAGMADIEALCAVSEEGVEGVICGRAIYSGDLDFAAAQDRADQLTGD